MPQPNRKKRGEVKKKVAKKKATTKKKAEKKLSVEEQEAERCNELILIIRESDSLDDTNAAFEEIVYRLKPRIQRLVNRFNIAGLGNDDIMQEALYALRYKAIKDYDAERGNGTGWSPFDKFAILCIRRHLSTEYKASYQNKKRVLNQSMSLDHETRTSSDDDLSLINIVPSDDPNVLVSVMEKEYYRDLMGRLLKSLSAFEKEVFLLYAQRYSYEEIAAKINENRAKVKVNIKGVDNALSRIKNKARVILIQYEQNQVPDEDTD